MSIIFEQRCSDSPYVERIWRSRSDSAGEFISLAFSHWQMVVWTENGRPRITVRGPETLATAEHVPNHAEYVAITFRFGTFMPLLPASSLVDNAVTLPESSNQTFWLNSSLWEFPTYENADTFVDRLVRDGLLMREPVVDAVKNHQPQDISLRSVQRRYLHATGLTHGAAAQIERARRAILLLQQGMSILDTVDEAGYADQPHLTRSLRHFTGQTPAQIVQDRLAGTSPQLSFLPEITSS